MITASLGGGSPLAGTKLVCVDPEEVGKVWPHVRPLLRRAIARTGLVAFGEIERNIMSGEALLWIAWDGSAVQAAASTCLQLTDGGMVCVITACAGRNMRHWLPLIRDIEIYAANERCCCVRIFGRKGWARLLSGYTQVHAIIDKRIA